MDKKCKNDEDAIGGLYLHVNSTPNDLHQGRYGASATGDSGPVEDLSDNEKKD